MRQPHNNNQPFVPSLPSPSLPFPSHLPFPSFLPLQVPSLPSFPSFPSFLPFAPPAALHHGEPADPCGCSADVCFCHHRSDRIVHDLLYLPTLPYLTHLSPSLFPSSLRLSPSVAIGASFSLCSSRGSAFAPYYYYLLPLPPPLPLPLTIATTTATTTTTTSTHYYLLPTTTTCDLRSCCATITVTIPIPVAVSTFPLSTAAPSTSYLASLPLSLHARCFEKTRNHTSLLSNHSRLPTSGTTRNQPKGTSTVSCSIPQVSHLYPSPYRPRPAHCLLRCFGWDSSCRDAILRDPTALYGELCRMHSADMGIPAFLPSSGAWSLLVRGGTSDFFTVSVTNLKHTYPDAALTCTTSLIECRNREEGED